MNETQWLAEVGTDAAKWTDKFVQTNPAADWGTMVSWFAGAIEAGRTAGKQEVCKHDDHTTVSDVGGVSPLSWCNTCGKVWDTE